MLYPPHNINTYFPSQSDTQSLLSSLWVSHTMDSTGFRVDFHRIYTLRGNQEELNSVRSLRCVSQHVDGDFAVDGIHENVELIQALQRGADRFPQ